MWQGRNPLASICHCVLGVGAIKLYTKNPHVCACACAHALDVLLVRSCLADEAPEEGARYSFPFVRSPFALLTSCVRTPATECTCLSMSVRPGPVRQGRKAGVPLSKV